MITQQRLKEVLYYKEGNLYWKAGKRYGLKDRIAGSMDGDYRRICVDRKTYYAHRLVFLFHHGYLPKYVDHINQNTTDNNIENLREATKSQNCINKKIQSNNTSGYRGVSYHRNNKKWVASAMVRGKLKNLGYYKTAEQAAEAYNKTAKKHYGEFACLNET